MELVYIALPCLLRGGTEMQSMYLCRALLKSGYTVRVVCYFEYSPEIVREFEKIGCEVILLKYERSISSFEFISSFKNFLKQRKPDIIHVQYMAPGALPIVAARLAGVKKVIATVHQPYTSSHGFKAKILLRTAFLLCDYFTCVSLAVEQSWFGNSRLLKNLPNKKVRHGTIYNTVDTEFVAKLADASKGAEIRSFLKMDGKFVVGYYGRMRVEKGFDVLCASFSELYKHDRELTLLVVGDGPQKAEMQEQYGSEAFWSAISFVGEKPWADAIAFLAAMDVVIIPSRFEGFGLSAVEAMAAGKPVIASRTGGLPEVVEEGKTGLLVEQGDTVELGNSIKFLKNNQSVLLKMADTSVISAKRFSFDKYSAHIQSLYLTLLNKQL